MAKKVFKYVCELGCEILRIMLERYDEAMRMEKIDLISTNLAERIAMLAAEASYRVTEETISETYGQSISHAGTWNLIQQPARNRRVCGRNCSVEAGCVRIS